MDKIFFALFILLVLVFFSKNIKEGLSCDTNNNFALRSNSTGFGPSQVCCQTNTQVGVTYPTKDTAGTQLKCCPNGYTNHIKVNASSDGTIYNCYSGKSDSTSTNKKINGTPWSATPYAIPT